MSSTSSSPSREDKDVAQKDPLMQAALHGNVEFLKDCIASKKPNNYYLTIFTKKQHDKNNFGNIFHLAVLKNKKDFIREAIERLPLEVVQQLLLQPQDKEEKENPLHIAAERGKLEIVELFLDVYKSSPMDDPSKRPWLQKSSDGENPCYTAISNYEERCGFEIWKMDPELLSKDVTNDSIGVLYEAIRSRLHRFALDILSSSYDVTYQGIYDNTPIHRVTNLDQGEGEKILKLLLKKQPEQIKHMNEDGESVFHKWAYGGQIWPFECLLRSSDIIRNVREIFVQLVASSTHDEGNNPIHVLAGISAHYKEEHIKIAKLLIDTYKKEVAKKELDISEDKLPWLVPNKVGYTPLSLAIQNEDETLAICILSVDNNTLKCSNDALFLAIEKERYKTLDMMMEIVKNKKWPELLINAEGQTALHLAPKCTKDTFFIQILEEYPELLEEFDDDGTSALMSWVKANDRRPVEHILKSEDRKFTKRLAELTYDTDYDNNNPFHIAIMSPQRAVVDQMVELLVKVYKKEYNDQKDFTPRRLPWNRPNDDGEAPLHLAIKNKQQNLALYLLSLSQYKKDGGEVDDSKDTLLDVLDLYEEKHQILFFAIDYQCYQVATEILKRLKRLIELKDLDKNYWDDYLMDSSKKRSILHLAPKIKDEIIGKQIVNDAIEFICKKDENEKTPIEEACDVGATWFITEVYKAKPSALNSVPFAWVNACEKGHISTIRAYMEFDLGAFRDFCIQNKKTPLHHLQNQNLTKYEEILKLPLMKDIINLKDSKGETALHKAIRRTDKFLTEALLKIENIRHDIKDEDDKTAIDLLIQKCKDNSDWDLMCKRIDFDPELKTSYFQRQTNLLEVRNSLFVVAALLATITFTAGFTLPGGLDQKNGEAMMARRLSFYVFLISNSVGMCSSMLVLICLVWSMVHKSKNKSLLLMDRSMVLLMVALYSTILAFMTGVYLAVSRKALWLAIVVIVMCALVGISANRNVFYKLLLFPPKKKERDLEQGHNEKQELYLLFPMQNLNQGGQSASQPNENSNEEEQSLHDQQHPN